MNDSGRALRVKTSTRSNPTWGFREGVHPHPGQSVMRPHPQAVHKFAFGWKQGGFYVDKPRSTLARTSMH